MKNLKKKLLAVCTSLLALACCGLATEGVMRANAAQNLVTEGTMENGFTNAVIQQGIAVSVTSEEKYEGNNALKLVCNPRTETDTKKQAYIAAGTALAFGEHEVKVRVKAANATNFGLGIMYNCNDGAFYPELKLDMREISAEWVEIFFTYSASYDKEEKQLSVSLNGGETKTFDNVTKINNFYLGLYCDTYGKTVYMDNLEMMGEEFKPVIIENEDYTNAVMFYDFEDDTTAFGAYGSATPTVVSENAYQGEKALQFTGSYARLWTTGEWITTGKFYEVSAYVKKAANDDSTVGAQAMFWASKPKGLGGGDYHNVSLSLKVIDNEACSADAYSRVSGVFGIYSDGVSAYAYGANGELKNIIDAVHKECFIQEQSLIDFYASGASSTVYFDNVAIKPATAKRNVKIAVLGASDVTVKVLSNGVALEEQPEITEKDGVFTVKGLGFADFMQKYTLVVEKDGQEIGRKEVSFVENETNLVAVKYTATITVKDENGAAVTDATLAYGDKSVTANADGVYTLADLDEEVEVVISAGGKLKQKVRITSDENEITVTLAAKKPATEVANNLVVQGSIENGFSYNLNLQGTELSQSDEEQFDGEKSIKILATRNGGKSLININPRIPATETVYHLEVMAKSPNGAKLALGMLYTAMNAEPIPNDSSSLYFYPEVVGEYVTLTEEWQLVSLTFSIRFDEATRKVYYSINGGEEQVCAQEASSIATTYLTFIIQQANGIVYADNIVLLPTYDATATVKLPNGEYATDASFEIIDFAGRQKAVTAVYDSETKKYKFTAFAGTVQLIATVGETTYPAATVTSALNDVSIEGPYTVTVTLKDGQGNFVTGATVVARKGITNVGSFTDNGDGTYTLEGVMGDVTVVITKQGYTFAKKTVSSLEATVTIVGENDNYEEPLPPSSDKEGCKSSVGIGAVAFFSTVACVFTLKKRKENGGLR